MNKRFIQAKRWLFSGTNVLILAMVIAACSGPDAALSPDALDPGLTITDESSGRVGYDKQSGLSVQAVETLAPAAANTLASTLVGSGVTISSATYTGAPAAAGTFKFNNSGTADAAAIGFAEGIILSSGRVVDVQGPNSAPNTSTNFGTAGDADLNALVGGATQDAAVLQLTFVPDGPRVFFEYVFSSEEYNEYVNSQFNDVFGFFVNGVNYALVNGQPISVNNIHNGNLNPAPGVTGIATGSNASFYRNNAPGSNSPNLNLRTEMDGLTVVLTFNAPVNIGVPNTMKLAIADRADGILDSAVFIKAGTLSTTPPVNAGPDVEGDEGSAIALLGSAPDGLVAETVEWSMSSSLCTLANPADPVTTVTCADDGVYTATLTVSSAAFGTYSDDALVTVHNVAPTANAGPDQTVNRNDAVNLSGSWTDPAQNYDNPYSWSWDLDGDGVADSSGTASYGNTINESTSFALEGIYTLTFTVTDKDGGVGSDTVDIEVLNQPPVCTEAYPSLGTIWPPNHQFVPISVLGVTDPEGDDITITIDSIYQDEPVDHLGDGRFTPDGRGVGSSVAEVRAERAGTPHVPGNGRFYHISFTADDGHGGSCEGAVLVSVPHDQNKTAIDDGALYDSTIP